jgi:hypothetical protein
MIPAKRNAQLKLRINPLANYCLNIEWVFELTKSLGFPPSPVPNNTPKNYLLSSIAWAL